MSDEFEVTLRKDRAFAKLITSAEGEPFDPGDENAFTRYFVLEMQNANIAWIAYDFGYEISFVFNNEADAVWFKLTYS